jgi:histidinol dehydrogenase
MKIHAFKHTEDLNEILKRPTLDYSKIEKIVLPILEKVKRGGDKSLKKFALEYDHVELNDLWVTEAELSNAASQVSPELKEAIQQAKENIWKFHLAQKHVSIEMEVMPGVKCYRKAVPVQRVGLYVPGGTAPLFSTVLMLGIPALIAGCREVII